MGFRLRWTDTADGCYRELEARAREQLATGKNKSRELGDFKQIAKALHFLSENPRHPGLCTHEFSSVANPYDPKGKVWEAYAQNNTPGAYRIFWCYGPERGEITVLSIVRHP